MPTSKPLLGLLLLAFAVFLIAAQCSDKPFEAPLTRCEEYKKWIKKGEFAVALHQDYTFEQHKATIKVPDLDDYLNRIYFTEPTTVYGTVNLSDGLLGKIRSDPGVLEVSCESGWGTKDDL